MIDSNLPAVPRYKSFKNIPRFVKNPIPVLSEFVEEYGATFSLNVGGGLQRAIVSVDPEFIQAVLQKHHRRYNKSMIQTDILARYIGQGLLTSEGPYWLRQRRLIQPGFHKAKLSALVDIMQKVVDDYLPQIEAASETGQPIEITHSMMELAFNIVAKTLFSTSIDNEELERLGENISTLQKFIVRQVRQPYLGLWFKISGKIKAHVQLSEISKSIIRNYIQERRQDKNEHHDLLDMLLQARYEDTGEGMDDQQLLDESLILFVAGHETSGNALAWTLHLLSTHPEVADKLYAELEKVLKDGKFTFDALSQLDYTRQVIQESMRLYPPAWVMDRIAVEDDEILGIRIPKDTMIIPFVYGVHHSAKHWSEPALFRPERFGKEEMKAQHPYAYIPFGGGPRLCIGNNFAMMEMQLIIASIMIRYKVLTAEGPPIEMLPLVTLRPKNGIRLRFEKRKNS